MDAGGLAPLVGRAGECAAIAGTLRSLRERQGGIVAIEGEPGIGKSRLLADLVAAADGCTLLARVGQLATRLPALWMHGRARRALGRFEAALADLERGAAIAADTGRERILLVITVESVSPLIELGRLSEATAAAEEGLELARLAGNPRMVLGRLIRQPRWPARRVEFGHRRQPQPPVTRQEPQAHVVGTLTWCRSGACAGARGD